MFWMKRTKGDKLQSLLHAHIGGYFENSMTLFVRDIEKEVAKLDSTELSHIKTSLLRRIWKYAHIKGDQYELN